MVNEKDQSLANEHLQGHMPIKIRYLVTYTF